MFYNLNQFESKNIEYIIKKDIKNLQKACYELSGTLFKKRAYIYSNYYYVGPKTFCTYDPREMQVRYSFTKDIYKFLFLQDLHIFLGIEEDYFQCIMHKHTKNNASIYMRDNEEYMYKCFDESCKFKIGDINKLTECLTGLNRPKTLEFLMNVYGIILEKSEKQLEYEQVLNANIDLLIDVDTIKKQYPELYKRISGYIPQLIILHECAKRNLTLEEVFNTDLLCFPVTIRELSSMLIEQNLSGELKQVSRRNSILTFIGLLLKLSDDMILPEPLQKLKEFAVERGYKNYENIYAIPSYDFNILNNAEEKSKEFKASGMTVHGFTKEMLQNGFGNSLTKEVFPREASKNNNYIHEKISEFIKDRIYQEIRRKGYCFEKKDIYDNGRFVRFIKNRLKIEDPDIINKKTLKTVYMINLPDYINSYNLRRSRFTKKLKEEMKVQYDGSSTILYIPKYN